MNEWQCGIIEKHKINSLQVFRGFAALAVVIHHAALRTDAFIGSIPNVPKMFFTSGYLGVDFFFVLSGFIIMYAHSGDAPVWSALRGYAVKRLVRIFPAYLPVSIALLVLYAAMPNFSATDDRNISMLSSLLLMPADGPPALSVAWTLVHELMFYAVFMLFYVSRCWLALGLVVWMVVIIVVNLYMIPTGWLRYPFSLLNIEFMMGVLIAWIVQHRDWPVRSSWGAVIGLIAVILALILIDHDNATSYLRLVFAAGLAIIIFSVAVIEQNISLRWSAWLLLMGNASYSIYLIHNPLLSATQRMAGHIGMSWPAAMTFGVLMSLLVGLLYYTIVEKPALNYFKLRLGRS